MKLEITAASGVERLSLRSSAAVTLSPAHSSILQVLYRIP